MGTIYNKTQEPKILKWTMKKILMSNWKQRTELHAKCSFNATAVTNNAN